jgi:uncharacterized protein YggE
MKGKLFIISILAVAALALTACGAVPAQSVEDRTISINGSGTVYVTPDMASINLGVQTRDEQVKDAIAESNRVLERIRELLAEYGVEEADVQTTNFSVYPYSDYAPDGLQMNVTYQVDNTVNVTLRDLSKLGEILDAVIEAGANSIYGIQFAVSDQESAYNQAVEAAVENAAERAGALAAASGAELGELKSMTTYFGGGGIPMMYAEAATGRGGGGDIPLSPGAMEIRVEVTAIYAIQ